VYLFLRRDGAVEDPPDPDATPRRIVGFSIWLSLAQAAVTLLTLLPRLSLARIGYREYAFFDLALMIYGLPQRLRASFVIALIPVAAAEEKRGIKMKVPSRADLVVLGLLFAALDGAVWSTHALRHLFIVVGLHRYTPAEPLFIIILLAAPAELFYGVNSGLLQALGHSRSLSYAAFTVLGLSAAAVQLGYIFGAYYLCAVLVGSYWVLYATTRRALDRAGVEEVHVLAALTRGFLGWPKRRAKQGAAFGASSPRDSV
jgi:O-antigen/teichoic acid export membrane protein